MPIPSSASLWAIGDYGDIAEQVASNGRGVASALLALRPGDRVPSGQYRPEQSLAPWWRLRVADGSLHVPPSHWGDQERAVKDRRNEIHAGEGRIVRNGCAILEHGYRFDTSAD